VVLASRGYPAAYKTGLPIKGLNPDGQLALPGVEIFHAGVSYRDNEFITAGGRVLSVTYTSQSLCNAIAGAYQAAYEISFDEMYFRRDIGHKARREVEEEEARLVLQASRGVVA
jgi:phosphoribosylamine--glycine ligase